MIGQAKQLGRAGNGRAGDRENDGHNAGTRSDRACCRAPSVQGRHTFNDVGTGGCDVADERDALPQCGLGRRRDRLAGLGRQRSFALAGIHIEQHNGATVDHGHLGPSRARGFGSQGDRGRQQRRHDVRLEDTTTRGAERGDQAVMNTPGCSDPRSRMTSVSTLTTA